MKHDTDRRPLIIQGGMGAGISDWRLARAVSSQGQLGVVSGTALDAILTRRLQAGDPNGHMRRALDQFPFPPIAERIWRTYFVPGGKSAAQPFKPVPLHDVADPPELVELCIVANFVEVWLAREGHANPVGINYLEKIQIPHLASLYGAMLAGVDYVLMGAGIPFRVPGVLDRLARPRGGDLSADARRTRRRRDGGRVVRSARAPARAAAAAQTAGLPRHRLVARARGGAPQARQRVDRRLRRRRADRGRAQRPAARQDAAERARRTRLRRARRARSGEDPRSGPAVLARRRLRAARIASRRPWPRARPASRSARPSRSARSPACGPTTSRTCWRRCAPVPSA